MPDEKLRKILNPLINLPTEFSIEFGETCFLCGFPFNKEVREEAVNEAIAKIKRLEEEV